MRPKVYDKVPRWISESRYPIIVKYPHSGEIPDSVRKSKLCSSSDSRSKETDSVSKVSSKKNYIFHDFVKYPMKCARDLQKEYPLDSTLKYSFGEPESIFYYIGKRNTGTILHRHAAAVNILSRGRKKWLLFPPTRKNIELVERLHSDWNTSDETRVIEWERRFRSKLVDRSEIVFDFIQNENEMLFIPENWYHEVINLSDSRGIVFAFGNS